ncbi:telomere repeats-binding bouquet formation protein 1 isoform X2 [Notolabrus celidotus]|uniref:telomere repeats-binding bouquet formation protein 1 isoform X2 n=1 Tax=Notolabrus celidotus TaxID=1203425 RepID=UPI00148FDF4D|nr:telomere repeats-binding bouquet formation protein 1 isoform X2 [Notolabrus celidotus]
MDKTEVTNKSRNTVNTDLSLLLECLKCQMKCPDLQKQALLAIHSICENKEDNVDILRQMGGVSFVYNLSKSSIVHPDVKETALFTLCTLAEANVYCKNSLCKKETFSDLAHWLMKEDIPLTQKRVSVYLLSVLVANNKSGQTLAQITGCLDILLHLFRTTSPLSTEATFIAVNATQIYQLWASVCSALCGCVNNPQNEEGQRICVVAFPTVKIWLQQIAMSRTEIFQSICSFIAMTVASNSHVQESFSASGGLDSLTFALVRLASTADTSMLSCQLSVTLSKTLSACITDNSSLAGGLAQYGLISQLFFLLASPHLDPEERLPVLLTLGHCTVASEEHQSQLVQCGGLPLIITLLTEDKSEEVRKAATFILQTCKQATMSLEHPGLILKQGKGENIEPIANMAGFRSSARELLRRIDLLEKRQAKAKDKQEDICPSNSTEGLHQLSKPPASPLPLQQRESSKTILAAFKQTSMHKHLEARGENNIEVHAARNIIKNDSQLRNMSSNLSMQEESAQTTGENVYCPICKGTVDLMDSHLPSLEGDRAHQTSANEGFKLPAPVKQSMQKEMLREKYDEEVLQDHNMSNEGKAPRERDSIAQTRCAGCVLPFEEVTSRTFSSLQSSSRYSCDMHKVLQEATQQFRTAHCSLLCQREPPKQHLTPDDSERASAAEPQRNWSEVILTPIHKAAGKGKSFLQDNNWKKHNGITLTPLFRGETRGKSTSHNKTGPGLTPLRRSCLVEDAERREENNSGLRALDDEMKTHTDHNSTRRKRRDFSHTEVHYLLCGVKNLGSSWNTILWSYPFQPGRTNVDLAKKYRQLMVTRDTLH